MNKIDVYKNVDTILNIDRGNHEIFPYKKCQKLYEKHFFEDIYDINKINTHRGIQVLEEYEKHIKVIGDYLIQIIKNNIYIEKEFDINFFDNYLSNNFNTVIYYNCKYYYDDATISNFWKPCCVKSLELHKNVKNIGYDKSGMKYILKYISGTEDALNGTIDITNLTVTESVYNRFVNVIKYSSINHYKNIYTMSEATLSSELNYKHKILKEIKKTEKQNKSLFVKILDFFKNKNSD